jgi:acylphosphatase
MDETQEREQNHVARLVHYSGNVQGVGFRLTTLRIARNYDVTGYVKNLPDGRVELYVEGKDDEVKDFLESVHKRFKRYIEDVQVTEQVPAGQYSRFDIRH